MEARDELVIPTSDVVKALRLDTWLRAAVLVVFGVVASFRFPAIGLAAVILGVLAGWFALLERRQRDEPYAVLDRIGVRRKRMGLSPARRLAWPEIRTVRVARYGVRFEPHEGRPLQLDLTSAAADPVDILGFAKRHLPLGAVDDPSEGSVAAAASIASTLDGPIIFRFRFPRGMARTLVGIAVLSFIGVVALLVVTGGERSPGALATLGVILAVVFASCVALVRALLGITKIVLDREGVRFRMVGERRRKYPWAEVRAVRRTFLPNRELALRLIVERDDPARRLIIPISWSPLSEADLIASMRHLASPHVFEGP